jgi:hypothetical protein
MPIERGSDMYYRQFRLELMGQRTCPLECRAALSLQVNGTENVFQSLRFSAPTPACVHTRPDRAIRIVQDLRSNGPEQQSSKESMAMCRHHDQISLLGVSLLHNVPRRVAFGQDPIYRELAQLFAEKRLQGLMDF